MRKKKFKISIFVFTIAYIIFLNQTHDFNRYYIVLFYQNIKFKKKIISAKKMNFYLMKTKSCDLFEESKKIFKMSYLSKFKIHKIF